MSWFISVLNLVQIEPVTFELSHAKAYKNGGGAGLEDLNSHKLF